MGRYDAHSTQQPRYGAASLMSQLSGSLSFTESTASSSLSTPSTLTSAALNRCFFCPQAFENDSARRQHIINSPECSAAQRAVLERTRARQSTRSDAPGGPPAKKKQKVTVEEVADPDAPNTVTNDLGDPASATNEERLTDGDASPQANPEPASSTPVGASAAGRERVPRQRLRRCGGLYVEPFPDPLAGSPISEERISPPDLKAYMRSVGRMAEPETFEVAELLMTSGLTDAAKDRHLKSTLYKGQTPWCNCDAMHTDIDKLKHGPIFEVSEFDIFDGRKARPQYMVSRNIIDIVRDTMARPRFKKNIKYAPERLYLSSSLKERVFADAAGGDWWWDEQENLRKKGHRDATIIPLIFASDPTTVAIMCGGQKVYPVYAAPANITKGSRRKINRRAMSLVGYLPVDAFEDIENDDERRRLKAELIHRAMDKIMAPLEKVWESGVEMWCSDGRLRRVFPRIAAYIADFPEQSLQSCTSEGSCPMCKTKYAGRGKDVDPIALRDKEETTGLLRAYFAQPHRNVAELAPLSLKPVWPWWGDLPDFNLPTCFTPDLLHQVHQGIFKTHLLRWLKHLVGAKKMDERFVSMPLAAGMRRFAKGITGISQWTGRESKQMAAQILPVVIGNLRSLEVAKMVIALMNFMFRSELSSLSETDLREMEADLETFHRLKDALVVQGVYESSARFDRIPKLHMLRHYAYMVRQLGAPDGYNSEGPEHLHIEYAKVPWRASNKVEPLPQMVTYIQRQEAIRLHRAYLDEYLGLACDEDEVDECDVELEVETEAVDVVGLSDGINDGDEGRNVAAATANNDGAQPTEDIAREDRGGILNWTLEPVTYPNPRRQMAKHPTKHNITIQDVISKYCAQDIIPAITAFLNHRIGIPTHDVLLSRHNYVDVWHKLYLHHRPLSFAPFDPRRRDVLRAHPQVRGANNRVTAEATWDVALYLEKPNLRRSNGDPHEKHGIQRYRAGRVRAFFTLPAHLKYMFPGQLAYVETFAPFEATIPPFNGMHSTKPDLDAGDRRRHLVIPVSDIALACHLAPKFHLLDKDLRLTSQTDLFAISKQFWLNQFCNHYFYRLIQHWRQRRPGLRERLLRHIR
ncbi:hypothetical protein FRC12_023265 [Ceratobasidium sp. 428]|nr:hypothetical protein FRC12_023265 [Ceratobasidium sp. 428]